MSNKITPAPIDVWIFQANQTYRLVDALSDDELAGRFCWKAKQHVKLISQGHTGIVWHSGKYGGIYAIGEILSNPAKIEEPTIEAKYWKSMSQVNEDIHRVNLEITHNLKDNPILKDELRQNGLAELSILKMPRGTNFKVTAQEWQIIQKLIQKRS